MSHKVVNDRLIFNRWRPRIFCRIFGIPWLLAGAFLLFKLVEGTLAWKASTLFQAGLFLFLGLFLLSLGSRLTISPSGIYRKTRIGGVTRRNHIPAAEVKCVEFEATSELSGGDVGGDAGATRSSAYYQVVIRYGLIGKLFLTYFVHFSRTEDIESAWETARRIADVLDKPLEIERKARMDLQEAGLLTRADPAS